MRSQDNARRQTADGPSREGDVLANVVELAVSVIDGCDHVSFTLLDEVTPWTPAASSGPARLLDDLQYEAGEGPCLTALAEREIVVTDDVRRDPRWPSLSDPRLTDSGIRSVLSVPLPRGDEVLGALNVSSAKPAVFGERARSVASTVAEHAVALLDVVSPVERPAQRRAETAGSSPLRGADAASPSLADVVETVDALVGGDLTVRLPLVEAGELGRLCRAVNRLADSLQHRDEQLGHFAHDLATPLRSGLTVLSGTAGLLKARREQLDPAGAAALDLLVEELAWHSSLARHLLQLPELLQGRDAPRPPAR